MRRQNVSQQSTFPIKFYHNSNFGSLVNVLLFHQPKEDPTESQISERDIQCFLSLVVTILKSEKVLN